MSVLRYGDVWSTGSGQRPQDSCTKQSEQSSARGQELAESPNDGDGRISRDWGFSLPETIAALVLLAAAVLLLAQAGGSGWRGLRSSGETDRATGVARALMAGVGIERPLIPGRTSGTDPDGAAWTIDIEPHEPPAPLPARLRVASYRVTLTVVVPSGAGRAPAELRLTTIRLGARP